MDTHFQKIKTCENNVKVVNAILGGLKETEFVKLMNYDTAKEIWDKLRNVYQGDNKVQNARTYWWLFPKSGRNGKYNERSWRRGKRNCSSSNGLEFTSSQN